MYKLVKKEHFTVSNGVRVIAHSLQSNKMRALLRYGNTLIIFMVIGLIFSKELQSLQFFDNETQKIERSDSAYLLDENSFYQFSSVGKSFGNIELLHMKNHSKKEIRSLILQSVPGKLKIRLGRYLRKTMELCEQYQVDPFWALSVMWTESHFNFQARSSVSATGLMQIMPATGKFLSRLLKFTTDETFVYEQIEDPYVNIEMGVFYLKRLLKIFRGNYKLATVAYNMGPGGVYRRLRLKLPVGVKNLYLDKVRRHYKLVSEHFKKSTSSRILALRSTLVGKNPRNNYLYTRLESLDEVFHFVEFKPFGYRLAFNGLSHQKKSL
ncbi:hypothetical protein A9Q84_06015 [Halobacteriovorax marinus]|uniref:Transglycosylase SLT domain-containing protein n=1 Tax=Halobacteriovorax marinus TaxID=97084 RepID=A0A1Y5FF29_9BACT|nr:hypothetical protein A9Q84_06015 [Halobacteriovorax marinus]